MGLEEDTLVGRQNVFDARGPNQANTGAITTNMLRTVGCDWVLLGHSDQRNNISKTYKLIFYKVGKALDAGMGVTFTTG
jgi:triosephosphate isomerase